MDIVLVILRAIDNIDTRLVNVITISYPDS